MLNRTTRVVSVLQKDLPIIKLIKVKNNIYVCTTYNINISIIIYLWSKKNLYNEKNATFVGTLPVVLETLNLNHIMV